jgi:hypothetical protein
MTPAGQRPRAVDVLERQAVACPNHQRRGDRAQKGGIPFVIEIAEAVAEAERPVESRSPREIPHVGRRRPPARMCNWTQAPAQEPNRIVSRILVLLVTLEGMRAACWSG